MATPVGLTVPKLLPITGTFAPAFAAYFVLLSGRVSVARNQTKTSIGDRSKDASNDDPVLIASRCHANFVENVPLAILFGALVELNGGNRKVLTGSFAALFIARILHAEIGLRLKNSMGIGRPLGHFTTLSFIAGMAGYGAYLVKGYWGY